MSQLFVDNIKNRTGGAVGFPTGVVVTGVATFNNQVSIAGTLTYEDVTNVDSTGIVTAKSGVKVTGGEILVGSGFSVGQAGIVTASGIRVGTAITIDATSGIITATSFSGPFSASTGSFTSDVDIADKIVHTGDTDTAIRFPSADTFTVETAGSERLRVDSSGHVLTSNFDTSSASGGGSKLWQTGSFHVQLPSSLSSSYLIRGFSGTTETFNVYNDGSALFKGNITVPDKIIHDGDTNTAIRFPTDDTVTVETAGSERFRITSGGGIHFTNGELIERAKVTAGKLSDNTNIDLENGMVHLFTTTETTTSTPNIRINSSTSLNSVMATGEMISVTLITTAAAAGYSAQLTIDGNAVTENWTGGSAPSDGGSSGVDIYAYTIIKTANATFTVVATQTKTS